MFPNKGDVVNKKDIVSKKKKQTFYPNTISWTQLITGDPQGGSLWPTGLKRKN